MCILANSVLLILVTHTHTAWPIIIIIIMNSYTRYNKGQQHDHIYLYEGSNVFASDCWLVDLSVSRIVLKVLDEIYQNFMKLLEEKVWYRDKKQGSGVIWIMVTEIILK